jgi:hypothetical protein
MGEPRIVSPKEAQDVLSDIERQRLYAHRYDDLAHTAATEPDRIRTAVVKALRLLAQTRRELAEYGRLHSGNTGTIGALEVEASNLARDADRIEGGGDFA